MASRSEDPDAPQYIPKSKRFQHTQHETCQDIEPSSKRYCESASNRGDRYSRYVITSFLFDMGKPLQCGRRKPHRIGCHWCRVKASSFLAQVENSSPSATSSSAATCLAISACRSRSPRFRRRLGAAAAASTSCNGGECTHGVSKRSW